jgi:hypothetical protein
MLAVNSLSEHFFVALTTNDAFTRCDDKLVHTPLAASCMVPLMQLLSVP